MSKRLHSLNVCFKTDKVFKKQSFCWKQVSVSPGLETNVRGRNIISQFHIVNIQIIISQFSVMLMAK
jgi:hypothetical protein